MPTLADIFSAADSFKRRLTDAASNPGESLQQMLGYANDRARAQNQSDQAALNEFRQTGKLNGPIQMQNALDTAQGYSPVGMTVWHGSPYKFTGFDPSKVGTNQGSLYGHGTYLTENANEAAKYASKSPNQGNLYKINIDDKHINNMLDWDKPISEQSKQVQTAFQNIKNDPSIHPDLKNWLNSNPNTTGGNLYRQLSRTMFDSSPENASNMLQKLNVPGIKYVNTANQSGGSTARNFTIFPGNENLMQIQDINGNPL